MTQLPDSIGIVLPPEWVEVGVDRHSFDERWEVMRSEYRQGPNWSRPAERRLEVFMRGIQQLIEQQRVVFCASFLATRAPEVDEEPVSEDGAGDPDPLMAACVISVLTRSELGSDIRLTADSVLLAYTATPPSSVEDRFTNLEPPAIVDLDRPGTAVRLVRVASLGDDAIDATKAFTETFILPISEGEAVCVVQFTTPNVEDAVPFSELFGAIARTLRIFYEDTPTFEPDPEPVA